jgi:uncharacterized protein with NRDE domain
MCLIAFAIGVSDRWPLVIASNRDEYLDRPTLPLSRWQTASGQDIISGRDIQAGGTWLGMTPGGRIAFLTNVREAGALAEPRSRGELVMRWLEAAQDAKSFVSALEPTAMAYAGFNLVLGDVKKDSWTWVTNRADASPSKLHTQSLEPGVYGLSNAALDTPWPKTMELRQVLATALTNVASPETLKAPLWAALANYQRAPLEKLPVAGFSQAIEQALSSAFVVFPENNYGIRSSTILLAMA